jgi:hypothetical protein
MGVVVDAGAIGIERSVRRGSLGLALSLAKFTRLSAQWRMDCFIIAITLHNDNKSASTAAAW